MKIHAVKQGSGEWVHLRMGIPTASELDSLISPEWKTRTGKGPTTYLYGKLCCKVTGIHPEDFSSFAIEQGSILEHEAIPFFSGVYDMPVQRVGFITTDDGRFGASPDGLIGEEGGIEVKCPRPDTHLKWLMEGGVPAEHIAQVHGSMFATNRRWWYFLSYSRQFPALVIRVERDEKIQASIRSAVEAFYEKFDSAYAKIKAMRDEDNAIKDAAYNAAPRGRD